MSEIENVALPEEKPKKPRARRQAAKDKTVKSYAGLVAATKFILPSQTKSGALETQFALMVKATDGIGWIVGSDGVLTMATPSGEDLECSPHTHQLHAALSKCGSTIAVAQLPEGVAVLSGNFRALIPTTTAPLMAPFPDANVYPINNTLKAAFKSCLGVIEDVADPVRAALHVSGPTVFGTSGTTLVQAFHGFDLPTMSIPRASAKAIAACEKDFIGFGYGVTSATFHCADGSSIRTALFESVINYDSIVEKARVNECIGCAPVGEEFYNAVQTAAVFTEDAIVFMLKDRISSALNAENGATISGLSVPEKMAFNAKLIKAVAPFDKVKFVEDRMLFTNGANVRGVVMAVDINKITDDDIPF